MITTTAAAALIARHPVTTASMLLTAVRDVTHLLTAMWTNKPPAVLPAAVTPASASSSSSSSATPVSIRQRLGVLGIDYRVQHVEALVKDIEPSVLLMSSAAVQHVMKRLHLVVDALHTELQNLHKQLADYETWWWFSSLVFSLDCSSTLGRIETLNKELQTGVRDLESSVVIARAVLHSGIAVGVDVATDKEKGQEADSATITTTRVTT